MGIFTSYQLSFSVKSDGDGWSEDGREWSLHIATGDCHKNNNLILPFKFMVIPYGQRRSTSFLEYVRPEKAIKFWLAIMNSKQPS